MQTQMAGSGNNIVDSLGRVKCITKITRHRRSKRITLMAFEEKATKQTNKKLESYRISEV